MLVCWKSHGGASTAVIQRSLMHFGGMMAHAQSQTQMMIIVQLLWCLTMVVIGIRTVVVVLLI